MHKRVSIGILATTITGLVVTGVIIVSQGAWRSDASGEVSPVGEQPAEPASPVASRTGTDALLPLCGFRTGMTLAHELRLTVTPKVDAGALIGSGSRSAVTLDTPEVHVAGTLHQRVLRAGPDGGWVIAVAIPDLSLDGAGTIAPKELQVYRRPFVTTLAADCTYTGFAFDDELPLAGAGILRRTLRLTEFAGPDAPASTHWSTEQYDDTGIYRASYERRGSRVTRARLEYARVWPPSAFAEHPPAMRHTIDSSNAVGVVAQDGAWFSQMRIRERSGVSVSGKPVSSAAVDLRLVAVDVPGVLNDFVEADTLAWTRAQGPPPSEAPARSVEPEIAEMTLDQVMAGYAAALRADRRAGFSKALNLLVDALTANPAFAAQIIERLEGGGVPGDVQSILFLALERANTPEAQAALRRALQSDTLSSENRSRAAVALAEVPKPDQSSVEALIEASRAHRDGAHVDTGTNSATLALGRLEQRLLGRGEDALAVQVQDEISMRLANNTDPVEAVELLGAIGNSGQPEWLEPLSPWLEDERPVVRRSAIMAVRAMPPEQTAEIFATRLEAEEEWAVRASLVEAFEQQAQNSQQAPLPAVVAAAASRLPVEPNYKTRAGLIRLLGLAASTNIVARQALVSHFPHERESALLVLIGRYVQSFELPLKG